MAETIRTDSSTATTPPLDPSHHSSKESGGIADAGAKDDAMPSPGAAGDSNNQAAIAAGPPDKPEPRPGNARVEKMQPRILPLLGKPYFACVVCRSHIQPPFQVVVPRSLAPFLPPKPAPATLTWQGRPWEMRFTGGRPIQRLDAGWRSFAVDNALRLGDGCVFELVSGDGEGVVFQVQVLRAEIPARIRERAGGYNSSSAIVIEED